MQEMAERDKRVKRQPGVTRESAEDRGCNGGEAMSGQGNRRVLGLPASRSLRTRVPRVTFFELVASWRWPERESAV
jgi:hypothetical protein